MPGAPNPTTYKAPGALSALEIALLALAAGFSISQIPTVIQLAFAESRFRVKATHSNTNGSTDYGLMQVNSVHGFDSQRLVSDPLYNLEAAHQVFLQQGWGAWSTYGNADFKQAALLGQQARDTVAGQNTLGRIKEVAAILAPYIGFAAASTEAETGAGAGAGGAGGAASAAASGAARGLAQGLTTASLAALFTSTQFWIRLGEAVAAIILLAMGLRSLTGTATTPMTVARAAARRV